MASGSAISVKCPQCEFRFKVDPKHAGRRMRCPQTGCEEVIRIPQTESAVPLADEANARRTAPQRQSKPDPPAAAKSGRSRVVTSPPAGELDLDARDPQPRRSSRRASNREEREARPSKRRGGSNQHLSRWLNYLRPWPAKVGIACFVIAIVGLIFAPKRGAQSDAASQALASVVASPVDVFKTQVQPFVRKYCFECHSQTEAEAGIDLAKYDDPQTFIKGEPRKAWEKVLSMLEIGAMPPADSEQPNDADKKVVVAWLTDKLFNIDCQMVNDPGRVTIRRLNRAEYNNTIRDLLSVDFQPADDFPSDDVGYGFDNIGDVLSLSPLLMEKYLDAAEKVTAAAIPVSIAGAGRQHFAAKQLRTKEKFEIGDDDFYGLFSAGSVYADFDAKNTGEYVVTIRAKAQQFGNELAKMELRVDDKAQRSFDIKGENKPEDYSHSLRLTSGRHRISVAFLNDAWEKGRGDRNMMVGHIDITSPQSAPPTGGFVSTRPGNGRSVTQSATEILTPFVTRAFRRPALPQEVQKFVGIVASATAGGETFDVAIQYAVQAVLISPSFLFRVETDAQPNDPRAERSVTDYELASRLSYFLWSSMPDATLFGLAAQGELRKPEVLTEQVKRLLKDKKSRALADNFAAQWLNLRSLDELEVDPKIFPDFSTDLRNDMRAETLLLFEAIVKDDRSVLSFLDADFTFVNRRLAKHYGLPSPKSDQFERVVLNPTQRAGVLTHASILTLTSNPDRTSPVKRGKWIMENILGTPPPPPPPNVPDLEETVKAKPGASLREQLAVHRESAVCASCHRTMDTLGFGFENFNAIGQWRERDGTHAIDASGTLPSGDSFKTAVELVRILKGRQRQFARTLTERMLTYSLGRGLEYFDRCAVDEIMKRLEANEFRFSTLVTGITQSRPFQQRRGDGDRD